MKTITIATSLLGISLIGCSDEADIGIDSDPITCNPNAVAEMAGTVRYNGETYDFDNATPSVYRDPSGVNTLVSLWSSQDPGTQRGNTLRFNFRCGPAERASYGVISETGSLEVVCPFEVTSSVSGSIEILPVKEGVLIIDETANCLAGRFRVDFDNDLGSGSLGGWFSTPWQ